MIEVFMAIYCLALVIRDSRLVLEHLVIWRTLRLFDQAKKDCRKNALPHHALPFKLILRRKKLGPWSVGNNARSKAFIDNNIYIYIYIYFKTLWCYVRNFREHEIATLSVKWVFIINIIHIILLWVPVSSTSKISND